MAERGFRDRGPGLHGRILEYGGAGGIYAIDLLRDRRPG